MISGHVGSAWARGGRAVHTHVVCICVTDLWRFYDDDTMVTPWTLSTDHLRTQCSLPPNEPPDTRVMQCVHLHVYARAVSPTVYIVANVTFLCLTFCSPTLRLNNQIWLTGEITPKKGGGRVKSVLCSALVPCRPRPLGGKA